MILKQHRPKLAFKKPWLIRIAMCHREALLLEQEQPKAGAGHTALKSTGCGNPNFTTTGCPNGHRGVWFYDPEVIGGEVSVGDIVHFECAGSIIARGEATGIAKREDYPKFCSAINSKGFTWKELK